MDVFTKLFGDLLVFVYHCFDRIVIHGYLSGLSQKCLKDGQGCGFRRSRPCIPM
jgi:hypothetical protein